MINNGTRHTGQVKTRRKEINKHAIQPEAEVLRLNIVKIHENDTKIQKSIGLST